VEVEDRELQFALSRPGPSSLDNRNDGHSSTSRKYLQGHFAGIGHRVSDVTRHRSGSVLDLELRSSWTIFQRSRVPLTKTISNIRPAKKETQDMTYLSESPGG
jgi:hypothetical protein